MIITQLYIIIVVFVIESWIYSTKNRIDLRKELEFLQTCRYEIMLCREAKITTYFRDFMNRITGGMEM